MGNACCGAPGESRGIQLPGAGMSKEDRQYFYGDHTADGLNDGLV